jgi:hypothetical protein
VKALIKWGRDLDFYKIKVAFTEAQKAQVENKGPGLLSWIWKKWK